MPPTFRRRNARIPREDVVQTKYHSTTPALTGTAIAATATAATAEKPSLGAARGEGGPSALSPVASALNTMPGSQRIESCGPAGGDPAYQKHPARLTAPGASDQASPQPGGSGKHPMLHQSQPRCREQEKIVADYTSGVENPPAHRFSSESAEVITAKKG